MAEKKKRAHPPHEPIKPVTPPLVSTEVLLAVREVRLMAGDVPRGALRAFYEKVAGLAFVADDGAGDGDVHFVHRQRRIVLERGRGEPGRVGLLVKDLRDTLIRLRDKGIGYEMAHTDAGLSRVAVLRDPAGNWVHLVETRPF